VRLWFDWEFIDTGTLLLPLSLGIEREDGATYYAEVEDTPTDEASDWVIANVMSLMTRFTNVEPLSKGSLASNGKAWRDIVKPQHQIAEEVRDFAGEQPEWWGYIVTCDWRLLTQLYGTLLDVPTAWGFPYEIAQLFDHAHMSGQPEDWVPQPAWQHHALADAGWNRKVWDRIQDWCEDDAELCALILR
jgi:3'-5' exoribonuclease Rv2179c-like domain